jgi:hypothetical protein
MNVEKILWHGLQFISKFYGPGSANVVRDTGGKNRMISAMVVFYSLSNSDPGVLYKAQA